MLAVAFPVPQGTTMRIILPALAAMGLAVASPADAVDQTIPGAGNPAAMALADRSPLVKSALARIEGQITTITDAGLRAATQDALFNPDTCVAHRTRLTAADKQAM